MALHAGLHHAVPGIRFQSGFSTPNVLKGRCLEGTRHLRREDRPMRPDWPSPHRQALPDARAQRQCLHPDTGEDEYDQAI